MVADGEKRSELGKLLTSASLLLARSMSMLHHEREPDEEEEDEEDADEWTWESYTPGSSEEEAPTVVERKKKKGRDRDRERERNTVASVASLSVQRVVLQGPKKKGKKVSPEALAEMARQAEAEAKRLEDEQREREKIELQEALVKEKKETVEQALRLEQLQASLNTAEAVWAKNREADRLARENIEWAQYLRCDGLPNPHVCGQMNTYMSAWKDAPMDQMATRVREVLLLLDDLTGFVETPLGAPVYQVDNWKWVRRCFRERLQASLDAACYHVLRDVVVRMNRLNLETYDYRIVEPNFVVCMWTMVELPTPLPNPRAPPRARVDLHFVELRMQLTLPQVVDCYRLAVRAMYLGYDHLSDLCETYDEPQVAVVPDLLQVVRDEWYSKLIYKYEQYRIIKKKLGEKVPVQEYDRATGLMPQVPYVKMQESPSEHVIAEEAEAYRIFTESLKVNVENQVINLRKYVIIGGIFFLNLYFQPPQPHRCVSMEVDISRLLVPKTLKEVRFCADYKPTPPPPADLKQTPSEIEAEGKRHDAELEKLLYVSLQLPVHVLWLDTPTVCMWNESLCVWSTADVHDFRFLEESTSVTFRTTRFGIFSFAASRFANLPYQTWDLKPEAEYEDHRVVISLSVGSCFSGTATLQVVAAVLTLDFNVSEAGVAVTAVQNAPGKALDHLLGRYFKLAKLKRVLLEVGVDVFPHMDAFCYVENSCEKQWPMERHLYYQMAQTCACYNFSWSRWNSMAGRRRVVLQMREYKIGKTKQPSFNVLHVSPLHAEFVGCSEVSAEFLPEPVEGMAFYADLYTLVKGICNIVVRSKIVNTSPLLVGAVAELLQAVRVLSFS